MRVIVLICVSFLLFSCARKENSVTISKPYKNSYARFFRINEQDSIKILQILNPWEEGKVLQQFEVYPHSTTQLKNTKSRIVVPVAKVSIHSLDYIGFISLLNEYGSIAAITDVDRIYDSIVTKMIHEGLIADIGLAINYDTEKLILSSPDIIFTTAYNPASEELENIGIPAIMNFGWLETHPLGRAEWIKVLGLLYNKTTLADSIFLEIENRYNELKLRASKEVQRKRIMFGSDYNGTWYMPGGRSYKAQMVRDAGADYNWFENSETGSLPLSLEQVLVAHNQDDIWLEAPWRSFAEMLSTDSRLKEFKSVKEGKVFNNFGLSKGIANGYWETGVCRPDLVLQDIVKICYPNLVNQPLIFYQNLEIESN